MTRQATVAGGPLPTWKRQLPIAVVLLIVVCGLLAITFVGAPGGYRLGLCLIAGALVAAAVTRMMLPVRRVGLLAVRNRPFDVIVLLAVAVGIVVLAVSLPPAS